MNLSDNRGTVNDPNRPVRGRRWSRRRPWLRDLVREMEQARRQERIDDLAGRGNPPAWNGDTGAVNVRLLCGVVGVSVLVVAVYFAWPYLVSLAVGYAGWRYATAHLRRRRPRSSWSSLGRTAAAMYAAWNTRAFARRDGKVLRVSVPTSAGREHRDEYGDIPF